MKTIIGLICLCAGALLAQDGVEKASVPLDDPGRPAQIRAQLIMGGIVVRGANTKEVTVEAHPRSGGNHTNPGPQPPVG